MLLETCISLWVVGPVVKVASSVLRGLLPCSLMSLVACSTACCTSSQGHQQTLFLLTCRLALLIPSNPIFILLLLVHHNPAGTSTWVT
jgi:hypothetical protein